jgi:CHC2 zinc finger
MSVARGELAAFWNALYGSELPGGLVEVRYRLPGRGGMGQEFYGTRESVKAAQLIVALGQRTDVYVGVAPRRERRGGRDAIERAHVLWADCDSPESIVALGGFDPPPAIIVHSGSGRHAYWPLLEPLSPTHVERANRRLAHALEADPRATDAARILRPPGTFNHKRSEPQPVRVERLQVEAYTARQVVGQLTDPPDARRSATGPDDARRPQRREFEDGDMLATIAPPLYVRLLTGADVGDQGGMIRCPLPDHEDRTPSCYVYPDAAAGWYCFGCDRGGSLIDFGAALWDVDPRGRGYHDLRRRLARELCGMAVPS